MRQTTALEDGRKETMRQHINRRDFVKSVAGASIAPFLLSHTAAPLPGAPGPDSSEGHVYLAPFDYHGVRLLDGMLEKQYLATRDYYFNLPNDDMLLGFRKRAGQPASGTELGGWYSHDIGNALGQWLSAMARMYKATGDKPILDKATYLMTEWGKTFDPDGYFYYSRHPIPPHYTYDKTLCGLVDLYHYGGQKEALPLMEKITDWAIRNLDRSRTNPSKDDPDAGHGMPGQGPEGPREWYTLSENLYRAYQLTGNSKYKTFGDLWRYPNYWGMFTGTEEPKPYLLHAYSHCNSLNSAAMTYAVTGDPEYLKVIVNAYDWFERTQFYATGGYGPWEHLQPPDGSLGKSLEFTIASFETPCGSWAGFKLAKYLMQFTGEARYGDWIEKLVYNGIGAALPMSNHRMGPPLTSLPGPIAAAMSRMSSRGQTFYYSDYLLSGGRKVYAGEAFPCCSGTYPQAVVDYHDLIYFKDSTSLYVNLFVPSQVTWDHEGNDIKVEQATSYPESDTTTLHITPTASAVFNLKFRVPEWCEGASVEINSSKQEVVCKPGTWATLERRWNPGDLVKITVPMRPRLVPIDKQHPDRVAVVVGPVVLVRENESSMVAGERDPSKWILPSREPLEYRAPSQPPRFVPFYRVGPGTSYGMYFDLQT